jgi:hypothetical protein
VDHEDGLFLEVLAAAQMKDEGLAVFPPHTGKRATVGAAYIENQELYVFDGEDADAHPEYAEKIAQARFLPVTEGTRKSREMDMLDPHRDMIFVDDVRVYMIKEDVEPEVCWVRIEDLDMENHRLIGKVLAHTDRDFGVEAGDLIAFYIQRIDNEKLVCCADFDRMDTVVKRRAEEADPLRKALYEFGRVKSYETVNQVVEELRKRDVWLPCTAILTQEEQNRIEALLDASGNDMEKLNQYIMGNTEGIELVPDILKHEDGSLFMPVFASPEDMGSYGDSYSKVEKPLTEVLDMVEHHQEDLAGIVVNPFSESMVLAKDLFDAIRNGLDVALSAEMRDMPPSKTQS